MSILYGLAKKLLFRMDAERAHELVLSALQLLDRLLPAGSPDKGLLPVEVAGLRFPNPIGLAAGFDKNAIATRALASMGFGFVEVGTITPLPQPGNPRPRLFRLVDERGVINRMGFNSAGAAVAAANLARRTRRIPVGVNVGPNKDTPGELVVPKLLDSIALVAPMADYLVLNLSSPNTPGLRDLLGAGVLSDTLERLTAGLSDRGITRPLFLKVSPDMDDGGLERVAVTAAEARVAGLIATNTTVSRDRVPDYRDVGGGLSGAPLRERADHALAVLHRATGGRLPLIGAGGIASADDAVRKFQAGASLVQLYTGLVFEGPGLPRAILAGLRARPLVHDPSAD